MGRQKNEAIEVLVVDDDERFRQVLAAVVTGEADMVVVGEAGDGTQAIAMAEALVPTVVLLDVRMPGVGGIEAARAINDGVPTTKVIMLTASDEEADLYEALRAGAYGYVLKENALDEVCVSVRAVAAGQAVLSPAMAAQLVVEFSGDDCSDSVPEPAARLSNRELEVLRLVADGEGNPLIAERLYLSPHTVKRHVANILVKLHQRSRLDAVLFAQRSEMLS